MSTVRFRPEVAYDLQTARDWYDAKRNDLGNEFIQEFWSAVDRLEKHPLAYGITRTGLRACRLARFPYVIHYRCQENNVLVVAVMHGGRASSA